MVEVGNKDAVLALSKSQDVPLVRASTAFDIESLIDMLAERIATRLRADLSPEDTVQPRFLTVEQAAIYLGRTKEAIQHMIAAAKIRVVRSDRRVFLDVEAP